METQKNLSENIEEIEEEVETEPVEITETMWYQHRTDKKNFEFLNMGQLTPLKRHNNTIISVKHLNEIYRKMYNNSNKNKLGIKKFMNKLNEDGSLRHNLEMLYCERVEKAINEGEKLENCRTVHLEFLPSWFGYDVDCYKIVAEKVRA